MSERLIKTIDSGTGVVVTSEKHRPCCRLHDWSWRWVVWFINVDDFPKRLASFSSRESAIDYALKVETNPTNLV